MPSQASRVSIVIACMCSLIAAAGCSDSGGPAGSISIEAESWLPFSTLAEARTFADYWVVATVAGESFGAPEGENGEGYVPRTVTLEVDQVL